MHAKLLKQTFIVLVTLTLIGSGCDCGGSGDNNENNQNNQNNSNNSNNENNQNNQPDGGNNDTGVDGGNTACQDVPFTGNVNFKKGRRLNADFAQALGLQENEVCNELGAFGCADFVHKVALGDPEPYVSGVYSPMSGTTISTTLIVERMAVYACVNRADRDFADPANAVIFKDISSGVLDPETPEVDAAITALYQGALLRNPNPSELERFKTFYADVAAEAPDDPAREWAVLTCFAVLSSIESAFY